MSGSGRASVLVVDDDPEVRGLYTTFLEDEYDVRSAGSGEEVMDELDDSVDVVLLDRRMPGLSGDEVLDRIRRADYSCRVAMVTAIEPDFDIVEMGFDDYLVKPVQRAELINVVDSLLYWGEYDDVVQQYFAEASKAAALQSQKSEAELEASQEYQELNARLEQHIDRAQEVLDEVFDVSEFDDILQRNDLEADPETRDGPYADD